MKIFGISYEPAAMNMDGTPYDSILDGGLVDRNSDGSDPNFEPSDLAPLGLDEVSTGALMLLYVAGVLFFLAVPCVVAWFYF